MKTWSRKFFIELAIVILKLTNLKKLHGNWSNICPGQKCVTNEYQYQTPHIQLWVFDQMTHQVVGHDSCGFRTLKWWTDKVTDKVDTTKWQSNELRWCKQARRMPSGNWAPSDTLWCQYIENCDAHIASCHFTRGYTCTTWNLPHQKSIPGIYITARFSHWFQIYLRVKHCSRLGDRFN